MSKKRILSNGYTSDYRQDNPTLAPHRLLSKEEQQIRDSIRDLLENQVFVFTGPKWMEAFDMKMKKAIEKKYKKTT